MQCRYAQNFRKTILNIFKWHLTIPREVKDLLDMVLMYQLFKNAKTLLQENFNVNFFPNLWKEKNQRIFAEKTQTCTKLFDTVVYQAISWRKLSNIVTFYNYIFFTVNWKEFCKHHGYYILFVNFNHQWYCEIPHLLERGTKHSL